MTTAQCRLIGKSRLKLHFHQVLKDGTLDRFDRILGAIANEAQLPLLEEYSLPGIYPLKRHSCFLRSTPVS
jgi:hypothetical protein